MSIAPGYGNPAELQRQVAALEARVRELEYRLLTADAFGAQCMTDINELLDRAEQVEAALSVAQKDAERYRWLRIRELVFSRHSLVKSDQSEGLDAVIDAAIAHGGAGEGCNG